MGGQGVGDRAANPPPPLGCTSRPCVDAGYCPDPGPLTGNVRGRRCAAPRPQGIPYHTIPPPPPSQRMRTQSYCSLKVISPPSLPLLQCRLQYCVTQMICSRTTPIGRPAGADGMPVCMALSEHYPLCPGPPSPTAPQSYSQASQCCSAIVQLHMGGVRVGRYLLGVTHLLPANPPPPNCISVVLLPRSSSAHFM